MGQVLQFPEQPDPRRYPERPEMGEVLPLPSIRALYDLGNKQMLMREQATTGRDTVDTARVTREIHHEDIQTTEGRPFINHEVPSPDEQQAYADDLGRAA